MKACEKIGSAEPAILSVLQLSGCQTQWIHIEELRSRQCYLTPSEYAALTSWLPATCEKEAEVSALSVAEICETHDSGGDNQLGQRHPCFVARPAPEVVCARCPPCIRGQVTSTWQHDQLVLCCSPPDCLLEMDISNISDLHLADHLCQGRAIFPYSRSDDDTLLVECLTLLRRVVTPYQSKLDFIVVRLVAS